MTSRQSIAVAVSGGRDSMALLHCTARVAEHSASAWWHCMCIMA